MFFSLLTFLLFLIPSIDGIDCKAFGSDDLPGEWEINNIGSYIWHMSLTDSSVWVVSGNQCSRFDKTSKLLFDTLASPNISGLAAYSDEMVYITSISGSYENTFMKFDGSAWYDAGKITSHICSSNIISSMTFDPKGILWYHLCGQGEGRVKTGVGYGLDFSAKCIYFASDDHVWMAGRFLVRSKRPYYESFISNWDDWKTIIPPDYIYHISAIAEDSNGDILIGTDLITYGNNPFGVVRFDGEKWQQYTTEDGLLSNIVHDIEVDAFGAMWISTDKGISCKYRDRWINYPTISNINWNPPSHPAIIETESKGDVWIVAGTYLIKFSYDETVSVTRNANELKVIVLNSNHPNPFNPSTTIEYKLSEASKVRLTVYSLTGQRVATLADEYMPAGKHAAVFDGSGLASGLYFYRLEAGNTVKNGRMMLVK